MARPRKELPGPIRARILISSRRRCCLCWFWDGDDSRKDGQIAHIDRDPSNASEDNLVYLCLPHHNQYDAEYRQSKKIMDEEVRNARAELSRHLNGSPISSVLLEAKLGRDFEGFTEEDERELLAILNTFCRRGIEVVLRTHGCVLLTTKVQPEDAIRLMEALDVGNLREAGVLNAEVSDVCEQPQGLPPISGPTLDEILAIPGNRAVYERLKAILAEGSAVAIIGAGASFPLYPLWGELIGQLADEPLRHAKADAADRDYWLRSAGTKPLQVAAQIRAKLGDPLYFTFLYETFKLKNGPDGRAYTPAQAALVRASFRAYLTTNYDPGLLEARRELRPDVPQTGFTVWNQSVPVNQWASGDLFRQNTPCPILFAHGHFADPENIVLDAGTYRRAYHATPYRRLFENLWIQQHLVFVGFSFSDVMLGQIADEVLWQTARQAGGEPRHVAILGLPSEHLYTDQMRVEYREQYHAEALFYPITQTPAGHPDHSALQTLLDSLAGPGWLGQSEAVPQQIALPPAPPQPSTGRQPASATQGPPLLGFIHESTEDAQFTGRKADLARLDRWAADQAVRLIAITAIGGLGKTALVGHWLKHAGGFQARDAEGIFFWSFYGDRDTQAFLESLLDFAAHLPPLPPGEGPGVRGQPQNLPLPSRERAGVRGQPLQQSLHLLSTRRLIVVLDGLEVVQESPGTVAYGKLLETELADFLHSHCRGPGQSLVVLTSRFPFPDLTPYLGGPVHPLALGALDPAQGAKLLENLGVRGQPADREEVSEKLGGHPLALRVFARAMPPDLAGDPTRLWQQVFDPAHLAADQPLEGKVRRLLAFYDARVPEDQRQVLGLLALFRAPVPESTLVPLWERLLGRPAGDGSLCRALDALHRDHLITADPGPDKTPRYACHPILRDHFRSQFRREPGFTRDAGKLLADEPDAKKERSVEGIAILATAIEMLLEAGDIKAADDLYRSRLEDGWVFLWLPAPHWGMEVARGFVRDEARQSTVEQELGRRRLGFFFNAVALFANYAGEPETALEFYPKGEAIDRKANDPKNLSIGLQNRGESEVSLGLLTQAAGHFAEALDLAKKINDESEQRDCLVWAAFVASLSGDVARADADFALANAIENRIHADGDVLYSGRGIQWAEHLLRTGDPGRARQLTEANRNICERNRWQDDVARCEWILGWLDVLDRQWDEARGHLAQARVTFAAGHMIYYLARTLVTQAMCDLGQGDGEAALAACERAWQLAAPRKYRLVQADALSVRARAWLERPEPDPARARDDAEAALQLAEFSAYAWAERDALELLARAYRLLGGTEEAGRFQARAEAWNRRLTR